MDTDSAAALTEFGVISIFEIMAWDKSKPFLERAQIGSIIMYLICLGGYTMDAVTKVYDYIRADIFGFTFFSLFIASTILLRLEEGDVADEKSAEDEAGDSEPAPAESSSG